MLLSEIFKEIKHLNTNIPSIEITDVFADSRLVTPGSLFVAIKGYEADGHDFIKQAIENGASAVVCERDTGQTGIPHVLMEDTRASLPLIASAFFGHPCRDLKIIGVTGTNGKTTVTHLIRSVLTANGIRIGLIGTLGSMVGDEETESLHTTPDALELHRLFARMRAAGCTHVVMEVSSHALSLNRVDGVEFECGVFTNLTQDHLDFHKTMEAYFDAKAALFERSRISVINLDDKRAADLIARASGQTLTYSAEKNEADIVAKDIKLHADSVEFILISVGEIQRVYLPIPGMFSVYNALAAIAACRALGLDFEQIAGPLRDQPAVRGRAEVVPGGKDYTIMIDYAHTPDGLENIIKMARGFAAGRVITLFGCGGDRDKSKRPLMAEKATSLSDFTIITSDNPRTEDPESIISDISRGIQKGSKHEIIVDRKKAIARALGEAGAGDVVILAGKGHETYQEIDHVRHHFDEREIVAEILAQG